MQDCNISGANNLFASKFNIVPQFWYHSITTNTGRPDHNAMTILSEIVYWYKPSKEGKSKFKDDIWQTSYEHFEQKFGYNKQKIRRAFVRLEELGLIQRELRTIEVRGYRYSNVLFIRLLDVDSKSLINSTIEEDKKNYSEVINSDTPSLQKCREHYIDKENTKKKISRSEFKNNLLKNSDLKIDSKLLSHNFAGKDLKAFLPLTESLYNKICSKTEKHYRIEFVEQLIEKLSTKYEKERVFYSENGFVSYMGKVLDNELFQEKIANIENFKLNTNYHEDKKVNDYLASVENSRGSDNVSLLKRKIAGMFSSETAYLILKNYYFPKSDIQNTYFIEKTNFSSHETLSEVDIKILLKEVKSIFGYHIDSVEIIGEGKDYSQTTRQNTNSSIDFEDELRHTKPSEAKNCFAATSIGSLLKDFKDIGVKQDPSKTNEDESIVKKEFEKHGSSWTKILDNLKDLYRTKYKSDSYWIRIYNSYLCKVDEIIDNISSSGNISLVTYSNNIANNLIDYYLSDIENAARTAFPNQRIRLDICLKELDAFS